MYIYIYREFKNILSSVVNVSIYFDILSSSVLIGGGGTDEDNISKRLQQKKVYF